VKEPRCESHHATPLWIEIRDVWMIVGCISRYSTNFPIAAAVSAPVRRRMRPWLPRGLIIVGIAVLILSRAPSSDQISCIIMVSGGNSPLLAIFPSVEQAAARTSEYSSPSSAAIEGIVVRTSLLSSSSCSCQIR
jgi:hypothetical protein